MRKRNEKGQFLEGISYSPETQFKKGHHWRGKKPFWDKQWLEKEYVNKFRAAKDIANEFNITEGAIFFWLKKHCINRRTVSEIRNKKHWGSFGNKNPMYGKNGVKNPNWKGGITPERNAFYSSLQWSMVIQKIWKRDKAMCQRCNVKSKYIKGGGRKRLLDKVKLHIHHIVSFQEKETRINQRNLILLCDKCHNFVHSKKNVNKDFLMSYEQFKRE